MIKAKKCDFSLIDLPDHEIKEFVEIGKHVKFAQIYKLSKAFSTIEKELDYGINKRWILESTLIKCSEILRNKAD